MNELKGINELTARKMVIEKDIGYRLLVAIENELSEIRDEYGNIPKHIGVSISQQASLGNALFTNVFNGVDVEI